MFSLVSAQHCSRDRTKNLLAESVQTFPEDYSVSWLGVEEADGALEVLSVGNNIKILQLFVGIKVVCCLLLLDLWLRHDGLGPEVWRPVCGAGEAARPL